MYFYSQHIKVFIPKTVENYNKNMKSKIALTKISMHIVLAYIAKNSGGACSPVLLMSQCKMLWIFLQPAYFQNECCNILYKKIQ